MSDRHSARTWAGPGLVLVLLLGPSADAHEGHKKKPSPSPAASVSPAAAAEASPASESESEEAPASPGAAEEAPQIETPPVDDIPNPLSPFPWKSIFTEHLHNKIIHFPFALGIAASLMLLAGVRWPAYEAPARALLVAAGLLAIAAFFTGRMQQEAFEDSPLEAVLKIHRLLGISTAVSIWVGVILVSRAGLRRLWPFYALLLLGLLTVTATFGGLLSHGQF